jgi:predicted component of type VI protein secretion system
MIYPLKNLPVNWVDGMKISKDHFIDSDKHLHDLVRDATSVNINSFNYGLLPPVPGTREFPDVKINETGPGTIEIKLIFCSAVTSGGFKIYADNRQQNNPQLVKEIKIRQENNIGNNELAWFDLILVADPFHRTPAGIPSLEENPPRHPFSDVTYQLQILPSEQVRQSDLGPYHFVIGKVKNKNNHLTLAENYIPPCSSVSSHPSLIEFHTFCVNTVQKIQSTSFQIVRKIHEKNRPSNLAKNFMQLCLQVLQGISAIQFSLVNELSEAPPVKITGSLSSFANSVFTSLHCMHPEEKEELLKYLYEWTEITPNDFEQALLSALSITYDHSDIAESVNTLRNFLRTVEVIWTRLNALEFIGQRKENIVVTKQTVQTQVAEQPKKRWSILD